MESQSKFIERCTVMSRDIDFTKKAKMSTIFDYFQDIAGIHAENLGIGFNRIEKVEGVAWVLVRMKVDILRFPVWNEEIIVETWPQLPKKYQFERDYLIKDVDGNIIIRASSVWVIIDCKSREMRKTEVIAIDYPKMIEERATDCIYEKLRPYSKPEIVYKKVVGCSDIDMNGHLNNSRYIDYIMDCFSMEDLKSYTPKAIQINYVNEALPGDTILLYREVDPDNPMNIYIEGVNEKENHVIFKCKIRVERCQA